MSGEQILVVEDQRAVAGALKMRLRGLGYDVAAIARDGFEAIEKASELHPDLILMDVRLGAGMDGIEAAQRIRSRLDIPVVFISAHVDQKLLERARATRPAGFINKPFTTKDLLTAIDLALHNQARAAGDTVEEIDSTFDALAGDGLITTDGEGRIGFVNRVAEGLLGINRRHLIDRPLHELLAPTYELSGADAAALVARILHGEDEEQLLRTSTARASTHRQQPDLLTPLCDARGEVYGAALKLSANLKAVPETRPGSSNEAALAQALDAVPNGVLTVGHELRVHHMNRGARDILARNRGLECRNGVFSVQDKLMEQRLRELVRSAITRGRQDESEATGAMFVRAPLSREHVELIVAPVPGSGDEQSARALVYLFDANSPRQVSHDILTDLYGLTQTEAKLVQLMSNGMTLDEAAQELEISVNTARTHLKHVFHKTGINRQTELIHRIGCGPASLLIRFSPIAQA